MISIAFASLASGPSATPVPTGTCRDLKAAYQDSSCCGGNLETMTDYIVTPPPPPPMGLSQTNPCADMRETLDLDPGAGVTLLGDAFANINCTVGGIVDAAAAATEQSGVNVTLGYAGEINSTAVPITTQYWEAGLCPVNVHWHLGAEHYSVGEYDEMGSGPAYHGPQYGPSDAAFNRRDRRLASTHDPRLGFQCRAYDPTDAMFTTPYDWKYCVGMEVGQTYEVHWPHSALGDCGTPYQYQSPFYDGVFCHISRLQTTNGDIGVQGQVFIVVNNESYYYPDMMRGMIVDSQANMGTDMAKYVGSTTGTSRNNQICSAYTPITWQVDRKCHMISASSFDKMCMDMMAQRDDMSMDLHAHGARELVVDMLASMHHYRR